MPSVPPLPGKAGHHGDEPAYALLVRALEHNGSRRIGKSIDRVMGAKERAASRWDPVEVARICKADPDAVERATPRVRSTVVTLMGQTLSAEHVTSQRRRWCPTCLTESAYHRVWWDVLPVTTCPDHGIELASSCGCARRSLQWRHGRLLSCSAGHVLAAVECVDAKAEALALDAYVVGRLRGDAIRPLPRLDGVPLGELLTVSERLGKASFDEDATIYDARRAYGTARLHAEGFRVLLGMPATFVDVLDRLRVRKSARSHASDLRKAYGELYRFVRRLPGHALGADLRATLAAHADANHPARTGRCPEGPAPHEDGEGSSEFSQADLERLVGSRTLRQVGAELGVTAHEVVGLATGGLLDVVATGRGSAGWMFPADAAARLLASLRSRAGRPGSTPRGFESLPLAARRHGASVGEVVALVLRGDVEVRARWTGRRGIAGLHVDPRSLPPHLRPAGEAGVPVPVAARELGLSRAAMDRVMAAALLNCQTVDGVDRIPAVEIERFRSAWATMAELRAAMGAAASLPVAALLSEVGVHSPLAGAPLSERIYPRDGAVSACAAAAPDLDLTADKGLDRGSVAAALGLPRLMVQQVVEAGLLPIRAGCRSGSVSPVGVERFREAYVTLPELASASGLRGPRAVLSILDGAGIEATCRRPAFCSYLFPRSEALAALRRLAEAGDAAALPVTAAVEPMMTVPDVAARLGTGMHMVLQLAANGLLGSARLGNRVMVPLSEVERFSRTYVFANELARKAGRTERHGVGAAVTKMLLRAGVRPVCSKPTFVNFVFDRGEATASIHRIGVT
ncbi:TniQ family protein [Methylobacterium sp. J-078]|uniref:TniQ family protein n=1 Tax=Methylobacterium sp. J-078 TaxID=2836657 RepID=UPI001FBBB1D6|nr:TniQ family protein [Methylobacterium sp. J-078]MCJ2046801.1 TniQ family protein [Methylobacterium sp. J-078]